MVYFEFRFLEEAKYFISTQDSKTIKKIFYNLEISQNSKNPKLFKKIEKDIWEFRTKFGGLEIRLLAFWDDFNREDTLVIVTHGFIKKTNKIPLSEIKHAITLRKKYFENKHAN